MRKLIYIICLLSLFSCRKESVQSATSLLDTISASKHYNNEILSDTNLKLYGQWQFLYIFADAGIAGGPGKTNPDYNYLVIKKYGIYGKIKDNKVIESGKIEIVKQDNTLFEIRLNPDNSKNPNTSDYWYVNYKSKDSLVMVDASIGCGVIYNVYRRKN